MIIIMTVRISPAFYYSAARVLLHCDEEVSFPCANVCFTDLIGNVYARFKYEDSAQKACDALNSRWYAARPIYCELSPVTDFREACCRLNSGEGCVRGGFCNFIHRKEPSPELERELELGTKKWYVIFLELPFDYF